MGGAFFYRIVQLFVIILKITHSTLLSSGKNLYKKNFPTYIVYFHINFRSIPFYNDDLKTFKLIYTKCLSKDSREMYYNFLPIESIYKDYFGENIF